MADDVTLPGTGAVVATDDIGSGRQAQLIKPVFGVDGSATMVSAANPLPVTEDTGTLVQRMEEVVLLLSRLLAGAGGQPPDTSGRTRVLADSTSTIGTVNTVTTVSTVTRLSQIGGLGTDPALMTLSQSNAAALALRDRITVS